MSVDYCNNRNCDGRIISLEKRLGCVKLMKLTRERDDAVDHGVEHDYRSWQYKLYYGRSHRLEVHARGKKFVLLVVWLMSVLSTLFPLSTCPYMGVSIVDNSIVIVKVKEQ